MWQSRRLGRLWAGVALMVVAVVFSGCLSMEETILGRYDAANDQFVFLNLYQRIGGQKAEDFDYLYGLWQNRDHLITPPMPNILGKTAYLRLSPKQFVELNIGQAPTALTPHDALVPLEAITVKPGTFFMHGGDALCYYDQILVPGKFIDDAILPLAHKALREEVEAEIARRQAAGKTWTIDEARQMRLDTMRNNKPVKLDEESPAGPLQVLSNDSLAILRKSLAYGNALISRKGATFTAQFPATEADVKATLQYIREVRAALPKFFVDNPDKVRDAAAILKVIDLFAVSATSPTMFEIKVDAIQLLTAMEAAQQSPADLAPAEGETLTQAKSAIDAMKAKGVPIDQKLTVEQVLSGFRDGSLKAYPSERPVKPGAGLVAK